MERDEAGLVTHGPPGLLGRFFLNVDQRLKQKGITFSFAAFEDVVEVNARNTANWGMLNPMFNPRVAYIPPGDGMCLVGRNAAGEIVATVSGKNFDARGRNFRDIVNGGEFFGLRPETNTEGAIGRITAPVASELTGQLCYCGGVWVHPEVRGLRLAALLSRLMNACMLTLWNPDFVIGFVKDEVYGTDLQKRYGYENAQPSMYLTKDGVDLFDGILLWMTADDAAEDIARFLDVLWPEIDAAVVARRGQNAAQAG